MAALMRGATGDAVRRLQDALNRAPGCGTRLETDGVFGPGTRDAVIRFQKAEGLEPSGIAGTDTLAALRLHDRGPAWPGGDPEGDPARRDAEPDGPETRLRRLREGIEAALAAHRGDCRGLAETMRRIEEIQARAAAAMREARDAGTALAALARAVEAKRKAGDLAGQARLREEARTLIGIARAHMARARSEAASAAPLFEAAERLVEALSALRTG